MLGWITLLTRPTHSCEDGRARQGVEAIWQRTWCRNRYEIRVRIPAAPAQLHRGHSAREALWRTAAAGGSSVKVSAYYSISPEDRQVYHDQSKCPDGERILAQNKRSGTDNRPYCKECPKVG
jgi:hypothetical protein